MDVEKIRRDFPIFELKMGERPVVYMDSANMSLKPRQVVEAIIFTRNTTEGLNLVINSLPLQSGDVVLTTDREHNSNLLPCQMLAERKGVKHDIVRSDSAHCFD